MPITRKARTPKLRRQWKHIEADVKRRGGSPGKAARIANGVLKRDARNAKRKSGRTRSRS